MRACICLHDCTHILYYLRLFVVHFVYWNFVPPGRDDKHWGGHYGVITSAATIRVQRESKAAQNDAYEDIMDTANDTDEAVKGRVKERDQMIARILADNNEILKELMEEHGMYFSFHATHSHPMIMHTC